MKRKVIGLRWATVCERPSNLPVSRPRGAKAAGLRYERLLAKALPEAIRGQWFEFEDRNGRGYCQTDLLLPVNFGKVAVLECKYTYTWEGLQELANLYLPVVKMALRREAVGVMVCKRLIPTAGQVQGSLPAALAVASGQPSCWHWISGVSVEEVAKAAA